MDIGGSKVLPASTGRFVLDLPDIGDVAPLPRRTGDAMRSKPLAQEAARMFAPT